VYSRNYKTWLHLSLGAVILFFGLACGSGKKLFKKGNADMDLDFYNITPEQFKQGLQEKQLEADWWQAKAKVYATVEGESYMLQANLKIQTGKFIWVSLRKLGLEVARIYITPDSAVVLNRIDGTYQIENNEFALKQLGFPIRAQMLEELALGKPILLEKITLPEKIQNNQFNISGETDDWTNVMTFNHPTWHLKQSVFKMKNSEAGLSAKFSQYQPIKDNKYISYLRVYEFKDSSDAPSIVELHFSEIIPDIPFEAIIDIPSRYKKI
jgi:hypothetical protein